MKCMKSKLDEFLAFATKGLGSLETEEFWPLNPGQLLAYFDVDFLLAFYDRYNLLKRKGATKKNFAKMFDNENQLSDFLINYALIGFKVAHNFDLRKVSFADREKFVCEILDIQGYMETQKWSKSALDKNIKSKKFIKLEKATKQILGKFKVALFTYNWSQFYDLFAVLGGDNSYPYEAKFKNKKCFIIIDDYYNLQIPKVWPVSKNCPVKNVTITTLTKPFRYKDNGYGRYQTTANVNEKSEFVHIEINSKEVKNIEKLESLTSKILDLANKQHAVVEKLTDLQKVDKAMLMNFYSYRKFFGSKWRDYYMQTRKNIKLFGKKFINQKTKSCSDRTKTEVRKMFDPMNNKF